MVRLGRQVQPVLLVQVVPLVQVQRAQRVPSVLQDKQVPSEQALRAYEDSVAQGAQRVQWVRQVQQVQQVQSAQPAQ
jgi:hypothetical protein